MTLDEVVAKFKKCAAFAAKPISAANMSQAAEIMGQLGEPARMFRKIVNVFKIGPASRAG